MKIDNTIIKSALLGFKNHPFNRDIFPSQLQEHILTEGKERTFLDALTLNFAYNEGGFEPTTIEGISKELPYSKEEKLPYCSVDEEDLLRDIIREGNFSYLTLFPNFINMVKEEGKIFPAKYMGQLKIKKPYVIEVFGETGAWIDTMTPKVESGHLNLDYLEMNIKERKKYFENLLIGKKLEDALHYLEDVFEAENGKVKLWYFKMIEQYIEEGYAPIIAFLDEKVRNSKSKTIAQERYIEMLWVALPNSENFENYFTQYFSKIFKTGLKNLKLHKLQEIHDQLNKIPFLAEKDIDKQLRFIFLVTPLSRWCTFLNVELEEIIFFLLKEKYLDITSLSKPLRFELNRGDSYEILEKILSYDKFEKKSIGFRFLDEVTYFEKLSNDEFYQLFEKHLKKLFSFYFFKIFSSHPNLNQSWSLDFSNQMIKEIFQIFSYNNLLQVVWQIAPYMHIDGLQSIKKILDKKMNKNSYGFNQLDDGFEEFSLMVKKYNRLKNRREGVLI